MKLIIACFTLLVASLTCTAQPNQLLFLQPTLSQPERVPELGLTPRYHALVFDYIKQMVGNHPPTKVRFGYPSKIEDFGVENTPVLPDVGSREPVTEGPAGAPHQPHHLLPSDFVLLTRSPQSQFFGNFDVIKNKRMKLASEQSALPPVGGVISNYVLQRDVSDKVKRQTFSYNSDGDDNEGVVISASEQRAGEGNNCNNSTSTEVKEEEQQPSVAQSKPQAIAVAGVGGVAQAAPVATAVVGKDGLAISAPSATAIAGQGTQGALQVSDEKMKRISPLKTTQVKPE